MFAIGSASDEPRAWAANRLRRMQPSPSAKEMRETAVACAGRIFYRPERVVDDLIAEFAALPGNEYPGRDRVANACYQRPIRTSASLGVFGLRALHWPMLNLLDGADRERRAFADAVAGAIEAARTP
jgi:hypothetical protein